MRPMRQHVGQVSLVFDDQAIEVPRNLDMKVEEILGPDQVERGSIVGGRRYATRQTGSKRDA